MKRFVLNKIFVKFQIHDVKPVSVINACCISLVKKCMESQWKKVRVNACAFRGP